MRSEADVARLAPPDPHGELRYVVDAVREIRAALGNRVPLIGFSGSPYTLACYMVEGGGSDDFRTIKTMLYARPDLLHRILAVNAQAVTDYLNAQVEAGAQALMLFDTWGGALSTAAYREFSLAYMRQVVAGLRRERDGERVPVIVFTKGGGAWLEDIADLGCDAVGLDWTSDLGAARRRIGARCALQGNLDPMALFAPPEALRREVDAVLDAFGPLCDVGGPLGRARLQPRPRHLAVHPARGRRGARRSRSRVQPAPPAGSGGVMDSRNSLDALRLDLCTPPRSRVSHTHGAHASAKSPRTF